MGVFLIWPTIKYGAGRAGLVINVLVTGVIYSLGIAAYVVLLVNLFVIPTPGLGLYYAAMLTRARLYVHRIRRCGYSRRQGNPLNAGWFQ